MKRLPFLFAVIVALCLSACGGKTITTSDPDSLFYADTVAVEEVTNPAADAANAIVAQLQKQMDTTDLECVKDIARDITKHLKELIGQQDMEGVESYTAIINNFIAENADKIREIGAAEILSDAITNMEGVPTDVIQATTQALEGIKTPALNAAVSAIEKGENVVDAVKAAAEKVMAEGSNSTEKAAAALESAKEATEQTPEEAKEGGMDQVE